MADSLAPVPDELTSPQPSVSWVLLTMGDRPAQLAAAIASIRRQEAGPGKAAGEAQVVVVVNPPEPRAVPVVVDVPPGVEVVQLDHNAGIPGGRNVGLAHTTGDLVFFLDDDAELADTSLTATAQYLFATEPQLGIITFRLIDPQTGATERRHVPRIRVGDPARSSTVTTFLGGACCIRRAVFDQVGNYAADFFYAMEESDLAWRAIDAGWRVLYLASERIAHPASSPARHAMSARLTARNRVWLVRRRLPAPLAAGYLTVWATLTVARDRAPERLRAAAQGVAEGVRTPAGERSPISWRTAARMTAAGRPPII